jgi:hypothetical protein
MGWLTPLDDMITDGFDTSVYPEADGLSAR